MAVSKCGFSSPEKGKCPVLLVFEEEKERGLCVGHIKLSKIDADKEVKVVSSSKFKYYLKRVHKLSLEAYNKQFKEQNGVCASCKREDVRRLAVDIEDGLGLYGLICSKCDIVVRNLRKNPSVLQYILKRQQKREENAV